LRSGEQHNTGHNARCAELTSSASGQLKISITQPHRLPQAKAEQYGSGGGCYCPSLFGSLHEWIVRKSHLGVNPTVHYGVSSLINLGLAEGGEWDEATHRKRGWRCFRCCLTRLGVHPTDPDQQLLGDDRN
jgi:hypothetical protein